jgi:CMP-N-acetylneuraminic acid synthetase
MKVIIPAKRYSTRVPDKNWRPFYDNKSLTEIKIEQLLITFQQSDIFLSCDDKLMASIANNYGIGFFHRDPQLSSDETPWPDALKGIIEATSFDEEEDILWVEVINPVFSDYYGMKTAWINAKNKGHDSLVLASPFNKFLLRPDGLPYNFLPGKWHAASQQLEPLFVWDSACIMKKKDLLYFSYPIGKKPFIYSTGKASVDIDTMEEFIAAQALYSQQLIKNENKI